MGLLRDCAINSPIQLPFGNIKYKEELTMEQKRFYYNHSIVYGWCVYDRNTNTPAYEACADLLPPVRSDESGIITESPVMLDTEWVAMRLCSKLNVAWKRYCRNIDKTGTV